VFGLTDVVQEAVTVGVVGQPAPAGTVKVKFPMSSETNTQSYTLGTQMHSGMALLGIGGTCAPRMGRIFFIEILLTDFTHTMYMYR
jgi:hypothetical protein